MADYSLEFTDIFVPVIDVAENTKINSAISITLFGFEKLEYGRELNENLLHILENFAVPEGVPGNPDLSKVNYNLLDSPKLIEGQRWYNKTGPEPRPYIRYNDAWNPLETLGQDVAANWGQIADGAQIPKPVSESGYVFPYSECSWIVSAFNQNEELEEMVCRTDENALVTMEYLFVGDVTKTPGIANYMIVGLRDNNSIGELLTPEPQPSQTATPTPTPTTGTTQTQTPTPTPTQSIGASLSATPPSTPTPTPTPTATTSSAGVELDPLVLEMRDPYEASVVGTAEAEYIIVGGTDYIITGGSGSGNRTYDWQTTTGQSFSISNPSVAEPTLSRTRPEGTTATGFGTLTVADTVTLESVTDSFEFTTYHTAVDLTPTPTTTSTPTETPTPTPTSTTASTPTPTPTPTRSSIPPLVIADSSDTFDGLAGCAASGAYVSTANVIVSGGIAPYTVFSQTEANVTVNDPNGIITGINLLSADINADTITFNLRIAYNWDNSSSASLDGTVDFVIEDAEGSTVAGSLDVFAAMCIF